MKKLKIILIGLLLAAFVAPVISCGSTPVTDNTDISDIIERSKYGITQIECGTVTTKTTGSGFIVSVNIAENSCLVITNYHVVLDNTTINVRFFGEDDYVEATRKGYNKDFDIVILAINYLPEKYHVFEFGNNPDLGQEVVSLGYTDGRLSAYNGIVSLTDKWVKIDGEWKYTLETTAPAPQGTSGGPCLNMEGKVIGLNCFNYTLDGLLAGVSYKLPVQIIDAFYSRIISGAGGANPAIGLGIYSNCITVYYINGKFLTGNQTFDVYISAAGALKIKNSNNADFPNDSVIAAVNGKEVDFCGLLAQFCKTGTNTEITLK